jgi:hypothetical protein
VVERELRNAPEGDEPDRGRVRVRAQIAADRAEDVRDGDRVAPRIPTRIPVHAEHAFDLRLEARLLEDLALDRVLEALPELDEAAGECVTPTERLFSPRHEDEPAAMEEDRVDRHARDVPRHARHSRLGVRMPAFFANAIASS